MKFRPRFTVHSLAIIVTLVCAYFGGVVLPALSVKLVELAGDGWDRRLVNALLKESK